MVIERRNSEARRSFFGMRESKKFGEVFGLEFGVWGWASHSTKNLTLHWADEF